MISDIDIKKLSLTRLMELREEERGVMERQLKFINEITEEINLRKFKNAPPGATFPFMPAGSRRCHFSIHVKRKEEGSYAANDTPGPDERRGATR